MKEKATLLKRILAELMDLSLLCVVLLLNRFFVRYLGVYYPYDVISYLLVALMFFIFNNGYMQGYHGSTLGKNLLRIKTVNAHGEPIGVSNSFVRELNKLYVPLTLFVGFLYALTDEDKQTWHDKTVSSYVVNKNNEEVFLMQLRKKPQKLYVRYYSDFDHENFAFLDEISGVREKTRCYKVYLNKDGTVSKFGYFVEGILFSYTKLYYEEHSTKVFEFHSNGKYISGRKYIFDKNGNIVDTIPMTKEDYMDSRTA